MEWAQIAALMLSTSGGTVFITKLFEKLPGMFTGRAARTRSDVEKALKREGEAIRTRDHEASRRRRFQESLSLHRRKMYEAPCIDPEDIPPWPEGDEGDEAQT